MSGHHEGGESRCLEVSAAATPPAADAAQPGQPDLYARHGGHIPVERSKTVVSDRDIAAESSAKLIADVR